MFTVTLSAGAVFVAGIIIGIAIAGVTLVAIASSLAKKTNHKEK